MPPEAFAWLAIALTVAYVVLPILVATLAVNGGLRITKARRLSFADALGIIGIYVGASLFIGGLLRPAHEALGIPPAWAVSVLSVLGGGIVFVALLRKRAELSGRALLASSALCSGRSSSSHSSSSCHCASSSWRRTSCAGVR